MKKLCAIMFLVLFTLFLSAYAHGDAIQGRNLLFNNGNPTYSGILAANQEFKAAIQSDPSNYLQVFNLSDISNPVLINEMPVDGNVMFVDEPYVYIAYRNNFFIYDLNNIESPTLIGQYTFPTVNYYTPYIYDISVSGDHGYLVGDFGLKVLDVSNKSTPALVSETPNNASLREIIVKGDHAFVASRYSGLFVYDITDPAIPVSVASISGSEMSNISIVGDTAYLSGGSNTQLKIVDLSIPTDPVYLTKLEYGGPNISVSDTFYILAAESTYVFSLPAILQDTEVIDNSINATVPAGLPPGPYDIMLCDRSGSMSIIHNAFEVLDENDQLDSDGDGVPDGSDACPNDPLKSTDTGQCGCNNPETDTDGHGVADCVDVPEIRAVPNMLDF